MGLITLLSYSFDGSLSVPVDPGTLNAGTVAQVGGKLQYSVAPADNTDWYPPSSILMRGKLPYFSIPQMTQYRVIYAESEITSFTRNTPNSHANFMLWQDERNTAWIYTHAQGTGTINAFRGVNGSWDAWGGPSLTQPVRVRMVWDRWAKTVAYQYWTGSAWATVYTTQSFAGVEFTRVAWYLKSWEGGTNTAQWDYILVQGEDLIRTWPGIPTDEPVQASAEEIIRFNQTTQGPTGRGTRLPGTPGSDIEDPSFGTQAAPKASAEEQVRIDQRALYSIPSGDPQKNPSFDQTLMSVEERLRLAQAEISLGPNAGPTDPDQGKLLPPRMAAEEEVYQEIIDAVDFSPYTTDGDGRAHLGDTRVNHIFLYDTAGEQWAAPSSGSGFYGAGRDGKHYYNGNECGPALNGTSFGTLAGGYNHKTWMTDVEPSAIGAGVTKVVMALVADDHVKFNSTSPLTGWETKGLWTRHRWCLIGDFDIQVEYENRSVSGGSDGNTPVLLAYVDDTDGVYMRRHHDGSYDSDIITNNSWGSYVNSGVKAWSAGKLRIVRVGQAISCYYWNAGWVALRTSTDRGAVMAKPMRVEVQVGGTGSLTVNRVDVFGFVINSGTPVNTAGWAREAAGATRGTQAAFPTKALIASTMEGIDIIDTATNKLWMRFSRATNNALWSTTIEPRRIVMRNGMMLVSYGIGAGGTICIDFTTDDIRIHDLQSVAWTGARLRAYNGVYWGPVGASGRDCGPVGIIASRNLAGGYSGDSDNWRIPSATVRFTDIYEDGGYLYKVHATQAGLGVHKWQRWYNDGAVGSNWWSPIYFSSAVTTDMWWCWVDPSDGTLYYMDSDVLGGAVGNIYIVPKATWTATASGGTFAASASKTRPSNRWWTSFRGFQGSTECFIKGGYIYHAADEGIWRIDSALAGSWELYIGSTGGSAVLPILPVDLLGVSGAQFCKDDSATANLLLLECVLRNGRYQLYVINFDSGAVFARGSLRKGRNCSYLAGNVV